MRERERAKGVRQSGSKNTKQHSRHTPHPHLYTYINCLECTMFSLRMFAVQMCFSTNTHSILSNKETMDAIRDERESECVFYINKMYSNEKARQLNKKKRKETEICYYTFIFNVIFVEVFLGCFLLLLLVSFVLTLLLLVICHPILFVYQSICLFFECFMWCLFLFRLVPM